MINHSNSFFFRSTIIGAALIGMTSCGSSTPSAFDAFTTLIENNVEITQTNTQVSGNGTILFTNPITAEVSGDAGIELNFTLEDAKTLTLYAFATNQLTGGIEFYFTRSNSKVFLQMIQSTSETSSFELEGVDATSTIALRIDIHNDEPHVLAWNTATTTTSTMSNVLYDSEGDSAEEAPGKGTGIYWGINLKEGVVLTKAKAVGALELDHD
jgi:hypothetical protein